AYLDSRHRDGGMADMTVLDYAMMVEDSHIETRIIEYRRKDPNAPAGKRAAGELVAIALTDVLGDGLSMVYSFFEPDEAGRSLGTYMVLDHIARARSMGLAYVYLGYWVRGSRKMDYKSRFLPQERLMPDGRMRVEEFSGRRSAGKRRIDADPVRRRFLRRLWQRHRLSRCAHGAGANHPANQRRDCQGQGSRRPQWNDALRVRSRR